MKEWKAPEKEAQKMTRDGAVSVNLVTGETTYPSDRTPEQDHSASGDTAGAAGKVVDRVELHREQAAAKKKRRKQRRTYREGEAAAGRPSSRLQFSEADQAKPELHNEYVEFPGCNFYYIPIWKFTLRKSKLRNPRLSFYDKSNVITKNLT